MPKRLLVSSLSGLAVLVMLAAPGHGQDAENPLMRFIGSKVKDPRAPLALVIKFKVKAGQERAFEEALAPCVRGTRQEPGSVAYHLNRDSDQPSTYVLYERWRDMAALTQHAKQPYFLALAKTLDGVVESQDAEVLLVVD